MKRFQSGCYTFPTFVFFLLSVFRYHQVRLVLSYLCKGGARADFPPSEKSLDSSFFVLNSSGVVCFSSAPLIRRLVTFLPFYSSLEGVFVFF